jgi:hypothetical protein
LSQVRDLLGHASMTTTERHDNQVGASTVEFRVEAQNALNTPQFGDPVSNLADPNFGRIIAGGGERRIQAGVRWGVLIYCPRSTSMNTLRFVPMLAETN